MKRIIAISALLWIGVGALLAESVGTSHVVDCGSWMELRAVAAEDFHFVRWSDGDTEPIRQIQVNEDATYIAFFASDCEEYANWPVVCKYDWLLMLHVKAINEQGFYFSPEQVHWYRVVGDVDDMHNQFPQDDQQVCTGYYLTQGSSLIGTGDYYAVIDMEDEQGRVCDGLMRSEIVHYASGKHAPVYLSSTLVRASETTWLRGLSPDEEVVVQVYSTAGQRLHTYTFSGEESYLLETDYVPGCYQVLVSTPEMKQTLRFIVAGN